MDLEKHDYIWKYLKEKDSYIAEDISRITIKSLNDIANKISTIATRLATRKKIPANNKGQYNAPKVYKVINNNVPRKFLQIRFDSIKSI